MDWNKIADDVTVQKTVDALKANGIDAVVVEKGEEAKKKVLELLPKGAEVMTMTSVTLQTVGLTDAINGSDDYNAVHKQLSKMDRATQSGEMQKLGAAPEWAIGSVHAVTEDGKVLVASNTGSQLPAYVYGAQHVIWVVGAQKIVKDLDEGFKRIYDYVLPIETKRARKAYGLPDTFNSFVSKLVIFNREATPNRITMIIVKEPLGF